MVAPTLPGIVSRRRHPSSGNLGDRPVLFDAADPRRPLDPRSFPQDEPSEPRLCLGPDIDEEESARLVGSVDGRRVLQLGCGSGATAIALVRSGAKVIVVDPSHEHIARARANADAHGARVEFHHGDFADLAFIRADQIDLCLTLYSLGSVHDVSRVFRQVHRVQRTEAPLLITLAHPLALDCALDESQTPRFVRRVGDPSPVAVSPASSLVPHRICDVFTALTRSNFRVDTLLEPMNPEPTGTTPYWSELQRWVPTTVVLRGRKQGI